MTAEHIERPSLLDGHADAITWVEQTKVAHEGNPVFGKLVSAVIWTDGPRKKR